MVEFKHTVPTGLRLWSLARCRWGEEESDVARACARVCDQLKGAPSALLQGRIGVTGMVKGSREAERVQPYV